MTEHEHIINLCIPEYDRTWTSNLCVLEYDRTRTRKSYIPYSAQPASSNLDNLRDVLVRQNSYEMYSFFIWMVFDWLLTTKGRPDNKIYCFSFFCVLRRSVCITVRRTRMYMKIQIAKIIKIKSKMSKYLNDIYSTWL